MTHQTAYSVLSVFTFVLLFLVVFHFATRNFLNPFKLIIVFGGKGAGKSTLLTKWGMKYKKRGWTVFYDKPVPGFFLHDPYELGKYEFPEYSVVMVDEAGIIWHKRNFKKFAKETLEWYKLQRKRKLIVILGSQKFDVDSVIRELTDSMYLVKNYFRIFSYGKRILSFPDLVEADGSEKSESRLVDQLKFDTFLLCFFGSRTLTYIPHWTPYFNSFDAPPLQEKEYEYVPVPDKDIRTRKILSRLRKQ